MQQKLTFDGNSRPLRGVYTLSPSQEYIRKLLFTAVLVDDEVVIDHVKSSPGLERVLEALQFLGVHVEWISEHSIAVDARKLGTIALPKGMLSNLPLYWFAFAALLARNGRAAVPFEEFIDTNGGLSKRISRLFTELGVELTHEKGYLIGTLPANWKEPRTVTVSLPFPYKEETEILLLLSATRNNVQTVVRNASSDNIVEYLEKGLRDGGAHIERHLHATLIIDGIDTLNSINVATPPDVFEAGLVALFTAAAGGEVEIRHTEREGLLALLTKLTNMGIEYRFAGDSLRIWSDRRAQLKPVGVKTGLFPKFSSRWIGPLAVLMSQAKGESQLIETVDTRGLTIVPILQAVGGEFVPFMPEDSGAEGYFNYANEVEDESDWPVAAKIIGPIRIKGESLETSTTNQALAAITIGLITSAPLTVVDSSGVTEEYPFLIQGLVDLGASIQLT